MDNVLSTAQIDNYIGWLPVLIHGCDSAEGNEKQYLGWLDCLGVNFDRPFFLQTIYEIMRNDSSRLRALSRSDRIMHLVPTETECKPHGIIFHLSRCGSTAIANCLKSSPGTQVGSEIWPLTQLIWTQILSGSNQEDKSWSTSSTKLANLIVWTFARCRTGSKAPVVLKLTSSSLLAFDWINKLWPTVPKVLITRDPLEIVTTSLIGGGWMNFKNTPSRATVLAGLEDEADVTKPTFSKEEFAVRVIANYCKIALKHRADFSFILDHKNISEKAVQYLAELFEIPCCDREKLILALATDAKTFDLTPYKNDSRDLLKNTSTLVRDLASELIGNSYANLLQQANWH